jgi:uncharacterized surface protein with fasciclin (FAS1) repeats
MERNIMNRHRLFATTALALPLAFVPLAAQAADVVETLKNSQQFSMFADAIEKAGLAQTLQGDGTYTIFAPTDEAFQKMSQSSGGEQQAASNQSGQQQQAASGQSEQSQGSGGQSGQQGSGGQNQLVQQLDSQQLKQVLNQHIIEGQEIRADDLVGKEQKVSAMSGDELTVDGTGTTVVLVPTGLSVARVGDEVFIRREVAAAAVPTVTVSPTTGQQGQQQSSQSQSGQQPQSGQQQTAQSGGSQQGQQSGSGQDDQQASSQSSGQGQSGQDNQPMGQQQGLLRAATVVEPDIQADNGVIHAIDQVIVPEKIEQQLMSGQKQQTQQQG